MAEEANEARTPFRTDNVLEDMMGYVRKLNALGDLISTMFWIQNTANVGEPEFARVGEQLGNIVMDYSEGLEILLDQSSRSFVNLGWHQEVYDFIGKWRREEDLCIVNIHLHDLASFVENTAEPAVRLRAAFEGLRKEILNKQKSAPAKTMAEAGA